MDIFSLLSDQGGWGSEKASNLPKDTELIKLFRFKNRNQAEKHLHVTSAHADGDSKIAKRSRPAQSAKQVPGQLGLHGETIKKMRAELRFADVQSWSLAF